ncbi:hypothetical protein OF83DRAFT_1193199, partial [Amylostereum chailletii]
IVLFIPHVLLRPYAWTWTLSCQSILFSLSFWVTWVICQSLDRSLTLGRSPPHPLHHIPCRLYDVKSPILEPLDQPIFIAFNLQIFNSNHDTTFPWPREDAVTVNRLRALELLCKEHTWKVHGVNCRIYEWRWNHGHDQNRFEFSIHSPTWHTCSNTHLPPSLPQGAATASLSAQDPPGSQGLLPHRSPLRPSPHRGGLFLDTTIASESSSHVTTPDFPLGFTRGANPGEYYALTLSGRRTVHWTHDDGVTAQWYFNDEEGFPYVEQTDIDIVAQEHDHIYNP